MVKNVCMASIFLFCLIAVNSTSCRTDTKNVSHNGRVLVEDSTVLDAAWDPSGKIVYFSKPQNHLCRYYVDTGFSEDLLQLSMVHEAAVSPDGKRVLYVSQDDKSLISVDIATSNEKVLYSVPPHARLLNYRWLNDREVLTDQKWDDSIERHRGIYHLCIVRTDGRHPKEFAQSADTSVVSADGTMVAYISTNHKQMIYDRTTAQYVNTKSIFAGLLGKSIDPMSRPYIVFLSRDLCVFQYTDPSTFDTNFTAFNLHTLKAVHFQLADSTFVNMMSPNLKKYICYDMVHQLWIVDIPHDIVLKIRQIL